MTPEVYIQKALPGDAQRINAVVEGFFASLPCTQRLHSQSRVLIKPNLVSRHPPHSAVTTHPDVLRAVILALQGRGVADITVADSPGGVYSPKVMEGVYGVCGIAQVCAETGAKPYTACESVSVPAARLPNGLVQSFNLLKPVAEADFIINLPKMKTHVMTCLSGAVKNLFGCIPGLQKAEFHMRFPEKPLFGRMLLGVCETVRADLHIVDGLIAMEGDGPAGGSPRQTGLLLAAENPYNLDLALCHLMGLDAGNAPMLTAAMQAGLCAETLDLELLRGDAGAFAPIPGFKPPKSFEGQLNFENKLPQVLRPLFRPVTKWAAPKPRIRQRDCIGCGKCAEICPQDVIDMRHGRAHIHYKSCIRCFCCHEMCPVKAIDVHRNSILRLG